MGHHCNGESAQIEKSHFLKSYPPWATMFHTLKMFRVILKLMEGKLSCDSQNKMWHLILVLENIFADI